MATTGQKLGFPIGGWFIGRGVLRTLVAGMEQPVLMISSVLHMRTPYTQFGGCAGWGPTWGGYWGGLPDAYPYPRARQSIIPIPSVGNRDGFASVPPP